MKISKAIEQLERGKRENRSTNNQMLREALQLGIEALKRHQECQANAWAGMRLPLPGETE